MTRCQLIWLKSDPNYSFAQMRVCGHHGPLGVGGNYFMHLLDYANMFQGYFKPVRTGNRLEFICRAFMTWTQKHSIKHILVEPGTPIQNAYIESFNGTFRDECLDENWFGSLKQARQTIATLRVDFNETRPPLRLCSWAACNIRRNEPPINFSFIATQRVRSKDQLILQTLDFWNLDWFGNGVRSHRKNIEFARRLKKSAFASNWRIIKI